MKFNLIFIVLVLGTVICTTFASYLTSSETDKRRDCDENHLVEVLKLMDLIVNLQQFLVDNSKHAQADLSTNDMEAVKPSADTTNSRSSVKGDRRDVTNLSTNDMEAVKPSADTTNSRSSVKGDRRDVTRTARRIETTKSERRGQNRRVAKNKKLILRWLMQKFNEIVRSVLNIMSFDFYQQLSKLIGKEFTKDEFDNLLHGFRENRGNYSEYATRRFHEELISFGKRLEDQGVKVKPV